MAKHSRAMVLAATFAVALGVGHLMQGAAQAGQHAARDHDIWRAATVPVALVTLQRLPAGAVLARR